MKEIDARKMECPVKTYCVNEVGVIQDRDAAIYYQQHCVGSDCIAWRTRFRHDSGQSYYRAGEGYCGLAGQP